MIEPKPDSAGYLSCTFCGKHQREVRKLVRGVHAVICDQCVDLYNSIIAEGGPSYLVASAHSTATLSIFARTVNALFAVFGERCCIFALSKVPQGAHDPQAGDGRVE